MAQKLLVQTFLDEFNRHASFSADWAADYLLSVVEDAPVVKRRKKFYDLVAIIGFFEMDDPLILNLPSKRVVGYFCDNYIGGSSAESVKAAIVGASLRV